MDSALFSLQKTDTFIAITQGNECVADAFSQTYPPSLHAVYQNGKYIKQKVQIQ